MQKVTIYGRQNCGFSRRSIELCELYSVEFDYIDTDEDQDYLLQLCQWTSKQVSDLPQILVDGQHIGGYAEFNLFLKNNNTYKKALP